MDYFTDAVKQYAVFTGRTTRKQYWMFILIYIAIYAALFIVDLVLGTGFLALFFSLVLFLPGISIAARRLHDTGRSGWWQLIALVPLIGAIVLLFFLVQDSNVDNQYGPNPKSDKEE